MAPGRRNIKEGVEREHMAQKVIVVRAQFLPRSGLLKVVKLVRITRDMHRDGIVMIRGKGLHREGNAIQIKCHPVENTDARKMFRLYVRCVQKAQKATLTQYRVIVPDLLFKVDLSEHAVYKSRGTVDNQPAIQNQWKKPCLYAMKYQYVMRLATVHWGKIITCLRH